MNAQVEFQWFSPLGISVLLFLLYGGIYVFIGSLAPVMVDSAIGRQILIISPRTDALVFGDPPEKILQTNPALAKFRTIIFNMLGGILVVAGILVIAVTWFGLRQGQAWALAALVVAGIAVLPFWLIVFRPYFDAGVQFGLSDLPPVFWVPGFLLVPAFILGFFGLR